MNNKQIGLFSLPVFVAALGYFVDVYDLLLFTIVRQPSVLAVGSTLETILVDSAHIINWQMSGLLIGGILWGVVGDKLGRLKVLFGSILLYSVANIVTGYVQTVDQYAYCRFIGGIGLAGELGAGITLVSEMLPKNKRGLGTSMVAGIGLSGAVFAYFTFKYTQDWRLCYKIGGGLGFFLLILRVRVAESFMFESVKLSNAVKGNFFMFFTSYKRFSKYIKAILIGLPTWFVIGVMVNYSNKFATGLYGDNLIDKKNILKIVYDYIITSGIKKSELEYGNVVPNLVDLFSLSFCKFLIKVPTSTWSNFAENYVRKESAFVTEDWKIIEKKYIKAFKNV